MVKFVDFVHFVPAPFGDYLTHKESVFILNVKVRGVPFTWSVSELDLVADTKVIWVRHYKWQLTKK